MIWTEEATALALRRWQEGASASEIATELHTTRNAVMSKVMRCGQRRGPEQSRATQAARRAAAPPRKRVQKRRIASTRFTPEPVEKPDNCWVSLNGSEVPLMELRHYHCRWPHDTTPTRYCGGRKLKGYPYCATHCAFAYETREQRALAVNNLAETSIVKPSWWY